MALSCFEATNSVTSETNTTKYNRGVQRSNAHCVRRKSHEARRISQRPDSRSDDTRDRNAGGVMSLGADVGVMYYNWVQLQKGADAAAEARASYPNERAV